MATTATPSTRTKTASQRPNASQPASRMVLTGVSWRTYECLLEDHADRSAPRFTYDHGTLEIMSPRTPHEQDHRFLADLVLLVATELRIETLTVGSMTFRRRDIESGFEPDSAFYIQHQAEVRGREQIDVDVDPPPDLVIEADATHSSLDKLSLLARFGVPEVWRVEHGRVRIYSLNNQTYGEVTSSRAIPTLTLEIINQFLEARRAASSTLTWTDSVRAWAGQQRVNE